MAEEETRTVRLLIEAEDRAGDAISRISRASNALGATARRTNESLKTGTRTALAQLDDLRRQPPDMAVDQWAGGLAGPDQAAAMPSGGGAGGGRRGGGGYARGFSVGGQIHGLSAAESETLLAARQENRVRAIRLGYLRANSRDENMTARTASAMTRLLVAGEKSAIMQLSGSVVTVAEQAEFFGSQLFASGGKASGLGKVMESVGGKLVAVAASFTAGYALGTKLDEWLKLSDRLAGLNREEQKKANEKYAKALGFRSAAEMGVVRGLRKRSDDEINLSRRVEEQVALLGAMPTNATSEAMKKFSNQLISTAQKMARPGEKVEDLQKRLEEATRNSYKTKVEVHGEEEKAGILINTAVKDRAKTIRHITAKQSREAQMMAHEARKSIAETIYKELPKAFQKPERYEEIYAAVAQARGEMGKGVNINFNNARFDITQQFAEGFDPDRIAVAFANDLAVLAERKLQSSIVTEGAVL